MFDWLKRLKSSPKVPPPEAQLIAENTAAGTRTYQFVQKVQIQTRRAQSLHPDYAQAIRGVCNANPDITACYVLDLERTDMEGQWLMIELSLAHADAFDRAAAELA